MPKVLKDMNSHVTMERNSRVYSSAIKAETKHPWCFFPPLNSIFHHPIPFAGWWVAVAKYMHNSENHYIIQCIEKRSCQASRSREGISLFSLVSLSAHLSPFALWKSWWGRSPADGAIQKKNWHFEWKFRLPPNIVSLVLLNNNEIWWNSYLLWKQKVHRYLISENPGNWLRNEISDRWLWNGWFR